MMEKHESKERFFPWDYGLSMDLELLCVFRRHRIPFEFMDNIWEKLEERKNKLQEEEHFG